MSRFRPVDRGTGYLLPPSVDEWLPENHLAHFIVEVVKNLSTAPLERAYAGRGSAKERYARKLAEYQAKLARREEKARTSGKKPGGKPPAPPAARPTNKDQINLTDEESRIMPTSGGGFEQAYNAQAAVDTNSMLIVAPAVTTGSRSNRCLIS